MDKTWSTTHNSTPENLRYHINDGLNFTLFFALELYVVDGLGLWEI